MPNNKLILRSIISPWTLPVSDLTTGSVLSWADVDKVKSVKKINSNFFIFYFKDNKYIL
jgi:hypothetical protein